MMRKSRSRTSSTIPDDAASAKGLRAPLTDQPDSQKLDPKKLEGFWKQIIRRNYFSLTEELKENPDNIKYAIALLGYKNDTGYVRGEVVTALLRVVRRGVDVSAAIPAIVATLKRWVDMTDDVLELFNFLAKKGIDVSIAVPRFVESLELYIKSKSGKYEDILLFLNDAAFYKTDISIAAPALVDELRNNRAAKYLVGAWINASSALDRAASNGNDLSVVAPKLVDTLKHKNPSIRINAKSILCKAAACGSEKTRNAITVSINGLVQSKWMAEQSNDNLPLFEKVISSCASIMKTAQEAEAKEVAQI